MANLRQKQVISGGNELLRLANQKFHPVKQQNLLRIQLDTIWKGRGKDYKFPATDSSLFRKRGLVYYIKLINYLDSSTLYKVGYTTTSLEYRLYMMGIAAGWDVKIIGSTSYVKASLAYAIEQLVHQRYVNDRYKGRWILANGNTELYERDILELDKIKLV
jgi:hypothetical protein